MIETRQLQYIIATADLGSFSQAAGRLRIKQSILSQRVRYLEHKLGVILFDRSTRGAHLTQAGEHFLAGARQVIADLDQLRDKACDYRNGRRGCLSIGMSGAVPPKQIQALFLDFSQGYPGVAMSAATASVRLLAAQLTRRLLDAIVIAGHLAPRGALYRSIGSERLFAVVHRDSLLAHKMFVHWADLQDSAMLMPAGDLGDDLIAQIARRLPLRDEDPVVSRHPLGYEPLSHLIGPCAFTVVSEAMTGQIPKTHAVVPIHEVHGSARLDYGVCWRQDNDNPALRNFLALIAPETGRSGHVDAWQKPGRQT